MKEYWSKGYMHIVFFQSQLQIQQNSLWGNRRKPFSLTSQSVELKLTRRGLVLYFSTFLASLVSYCLTLQVYSVMSKHNKNVGVYQSITMRETPFFGYSYVKVYITRFEKNIIIATLYSLSELQYFMKFNGFTTC